MRPCLLVETRSVCWNPAGQEEADLHLMLKN